ncbi:hypothetical protein [Lactobacillus delbrueckii]|uniref:hypothetical protein n=1 Tax=Lactobacillus delbrueckii TaxID=1584 RepID=UPI003A882166
MLHLKLQSNDFTVYFCLDERNTNSEWIDSSIEVTHNESQVFSVKPLWYNDEPETLLSEVEAFLQGRTRYEQFSLIDDPTVEISFDHEDQLLILRLYYSFDLADHITVYFENDQVTYLCEYLKLFLHKRKKSSETVQKLFDAGILQGD